MLLSRQNNESPSTVARPPTPPREQYGPEEVYLPQKRRRRVQRAFQLTHKVYVALARVSSIHRAKG
jgi:hypothetical protein